MDVTMAAVECLGIAGGCGGGRVAGARGWILLTGIGMALSLATVARADGDVEWVPPAALDDVPVRASAPQPVGDRPDPIVVPLPSGLHTGAMSLSALAGLRWWVTRRRA